MIARAIAVASAAMLAACVDIETDMPPWDPAAAITGSLLPELGPAPIAPPVAPAVLRIASWNVEMAPEPDRIAAEILASPTIGSADVILVQEIEDHPGEGGSRAARLAAALGPDWTWFYAPARIEGDGTHGDTILSRFPIGAPEVKRLPRIEMSFNTRDRIAQRVTLDLGDGRTLVVVNVHLDTRIGAVDRVRQLDPAVADNPPEVVVGGDLNTLPWAWIDNAIPLLGTEAIVGQDQAVIIDDYLHDLGFETPIAHDADTHDFPVDMRLDTICPRGMAAVGAGVAYDADDSDHYAVWIDLAL